MALDLDGTADYVFAETTKGSLRTLSNSLPMLDLSEHKDLHEDLHKAFLRRLDAAIRAVFGERRTGNAPTENQSPKRLM